MQLFLIDTPIVQNNTFSITESTLLHQMSRVLRMRPNDRCFMQRYTQNTIIRAEAVIDSISPKQVTCTLGSQQEKKQPIVTSRVAIATPNKADKLELIVQKLTEIGIDEIMFFSAQRSQPFRWNDKKQQRIATICKEATEQSWGWTQTTVKFYESIDSIPTFEQYMVTDLPEHRDYFHEKTPLIDQQGLSVGGGLGENTSGVVSGKSNFSGSTSLRMVGPEGGRGEHEYDFFSTKNCSIVTLGDRVLRMETAAIIVGSYARMVGLSCVE